MKEFKDTQIMLSKRGYIFYIEHSRIKVENGALVYLKANNGLYKSFNIPHINTSIIIVGEGSSITRDAVSLISEAGTLLMFVGSGGTPLYGASDLSFTTISPNNEYRPTQYMQKWAGIFFNEEYRLLAAKDFMRLRVENIIYLYNKIDFIQEMGISFEDTDEDIKEYLEKIDNSKNTTDLLLSEAWFTKYLYSIFAQKIKLISFTREHGKKSDDNDIDIVNSYLDHGNYLCYGLGSVTLHGLGISYAFPLLHGKTRRGALVFDVADLVKDAICLPLAFYSSISSFDDKTFRFKLIEVINKHKILDKLFLQVKTIALKDYSKDV